MCWGVRGPRAVSGARSWTRHGPLDCDRAPPHLYCTLVVRLCVILQGRAARGAGRLAPARVHIMVMSRVMCGRMGAAWLRRHAQTCVGVTEVSF